MFQILRTLFPLTTFKNATIPKFVQHFSRWLLLGGFQSGGLKFVENLSKFANRWFPDKFWQIPVPRTGTRKNNHRDKFWTNLGFGLRSRLPCTDPKSGLWPEYEKNGRKMDFGPAGKKKGKKWPKNGRIGRKNGSKMAIFPFLPIFPPFSRSGRRPDLGSVQGNRDRKVRVVFERCKGMKGAQSKSKFRCT